jgi:Beta-propeller repeat
MPRSFPSSYRALYRCETENTEAAKPGQFQTIPRGSPPGENSLEIDGPLLSRFPLYLSDATIMKHLLKFNVSALRVRQLIVANLIAISLAILFSALSLTDRASKRAVQRPDGDHAGEARTRVAETYGKLPMMFQANAGQTDARVKFTARGPGYSLFLTPGEAVFVLSQKSAQAVLRMNVTGANEQPTVSGMDELPTKVNYFGGSDSSQWQTNIATYGSVRYSQVYPGIDMIYHGNQRRLEYDFVVAPGADWRQIALNFSEAEKVEIEEGTGDLLLHTAIGVLRQHKPVASQDVSGTRRLVETSYIKRGDGRLGFEVANYDRGRELVIDPILSYSTFVGGTGPAQGDNVGGDQSTSIAVDGDGNAYVVGTTSSTDFPITPGTYQTTYPTGASSVAFVLKLNPSGTGLIYCSFFSKAIATAIAVDSAGNAYLTGSALPDFPTTAGVFQPASQCRTAGGANAFVAKLNATGSTLLFSTFIGGSGNAGFDGFTGCESASGIALDNSDNIYIAGATYSHDFPVTSGAFQTTNRANNAVNPKTAFVTKLNSTGTALVFSTYLGGNELDFASGIAVDGSANAYVVGSASSSDFPVTPGVVQGTYPGFRSAFVTKFTSTGAMDYSTFSGGSAFGGTEGAAIAVDSSGNAYITGETFSTNYPTTFGSFRKSYCGGFSDAYVSAINAAGSAYIYSTYLCGPNFAGGDNAEYGFGIAVDAAGNAYVTGYTNSPTFPVTADAYQSVVAGYDDAFLTKLNPSGSALLYSTFLGGAQFDDGFGGVGLDNAGHVFVAGSAESPEFPTTPGAFQTAYHGGNDVFVAKFDFSQSAPTDHLLNIATRLPVQTGDNVLIGGFIITGTQPKKVIILGIGPSLSQFFSGALSDPTLELFQGDTLLQANDNWKESEAEVQATGLQPSNDLESAIVRTLDPGSYTAILRGKGGATGIGVVQAYDLNQAAQSKFGNIATRGFIDSGDNVMIGGFIIGPAGGTTTTVVIRAIGPSLANFGVTGALQDPTLELHDGNGAVIAFNDNWKDDTNQKNIPQSLQPTDQRESALYRVLAPGNYTAVMRGSGNTTGIGLAEIYNVQ